MLVVAVVVVVGNDVVLAVWTRDGVCDPRCTHAGDCGVFGSVGSERKRPKVAGCEGRDRLGADGVDISEQALEMIAVGCAQDNEPPSDSACEPWQLQTVSVPSLTRSFIRNSSEVLATALRSTVIFSSPAVIYFLR